MNAHFGAHEEPQETAEKASLAVSLAVRPFLAIQYLLAVLSTVQERALGTCLNRSWSALLIITVAVRPPSTTEQAVTVIQLASLERQKQLRGFHFA